VPTGGRYRPLALAQRVAANDALAVKLTKQAINRSLTSPACASRW
jgi:hypothetical protein